MRGSEGATKMDLAHHNTEYEGRCSLFVYQIPARVSVGRARRALLRILALAFAAIASAGATPTVTLTWDRNPESDIAGYTLRYGTKSGELTETKEAGNETRITVSDLRYATTYYFTVVAYNTAGLVSRPSNEVSHTTPPAPRETHQLTVVNGTGSGPYEPGDKVLVTAAPPPLDQKFERWLDDYQILLVPTASATTATIPYQDVTITATYSDLPRYPLSVINGSGSGDYMSGKVVPVTANSAPAGTQFSAWGGADVGLLENAASETTTLTMPARAASVTANYVAVYTLTVSGGTGSGSFPAGRVVEIEAIPPRGQVFSVWRGNAATVANRFAAKTTLNMPARSASVRAVFRRR
jgi:Fibronectin type III domain/Divergent InlB B-repeat domain